MDYRITQLSSAKDELEMQAAAMRAVCPSGWLPPHLTKNNSYHVQGGVGYIHKWKASSYAWQSSSARMNGAGSTLMCGDHNLSRERVKKGTNRLIKAHKKIRKIRKEL